MSGKLNDSTDYGAFTYKKFTETFFKIEVISDCRYIVKDTDVKTDKEIVHRYQTQEDAWNAAMLCANRQTFDLSVKIPGSVHMSVNYKEQTISVIGSDNQLKRLYKVTTDVIPGWLIGVIVILGIMVMLTWMISGKNDKSIKTPEKETEKLTSKYNSEISVISKAVEEPVELEFWGKRNGIDQFRVKSIAGRNIVSDHVLLISFDGSEARDVALDAVVTGKEHSEYFGKIEMLYCKRQQGHYGTEKLKTEKIDKVILSKEQWENETGKIKLLELWNCIPFEK